MQDLAALLPNLVSVRRPSKSAIVNSSIALIHTQRRQRALAARELRQLAMEADSLRRQVNEWRTAYPNASITGAREGPVKEPTRSMEFVVLMELEDVSEEDMAMSEAERIAYEMSAENGSGGFGDEDNDFGDEELSTEHAAPNQISSTSGIPSGAGVVSVRVQETSLPGPMGANLPHPANIDTGFAKSAVYQQQQQPHASPTSLLPNIYLQQQQQLAIQQQQQLAQHQQATSAAASFPVNFVPTFDQISNTARLPNTSASSVPQMGNDQITAWNSRLYATALNQRQQQQQQQPQHQQGASSFQTPPNSSQGPTGVFGANQSRGQKGASAPHFQRVFDADESFEKSSRVGVAGGLHPFRPEMSISMSTGANGAPINTLNVPNNNPNTNTAVAAATAAPSVSNATLPLDGLNVNSVSSVGMLTSPVSMNLGGADPFSVLFPSYGNVPSGGETWGADMVHGHGIQSGSAVPVGGGGGGGGGYMPSALMSMFI